MPPRINVGQPSNTHRVESTEHGQERNSDATSRKRSLSEPVQDALSSLAKKNRETSPEHTATSAQDFFTAEVGGSSQGRFAQPVMAKSDSAEISIEASGDKSYDTDAAEAAIQDIIKRLYLIESLRKEIGSEVDSEVDSEVGSETMNDIIERLYLIEPPQGEAGKPLSARDVFALIYSYPYLEDYFLEEDISDLIFKKMRPDSQTNESLLLINVAVALLTCQRRKNNKNSDTKFETSEHNRPLDMGYIDSLLKTLIEGVSAAVAMQHEVENSANSQEYSDARDAANHLMSLYREHDEEFIEAFTILQNAYDLREATSSSSPSNELAPVA